MFQLSLLHIPGSIYLTRMDLYLLQLSWNFTNNYKIIKYSIFCLKCLIWGDDFTLPVIVRVHHIWLIFTISTLFSKQAFSTSSEFNILIGIGHQEHWEKRLWFSDHFGQLPHSFSLIYLLIITLYYCLPGAPKWFLNLAIQY